MPSDRRRMLEWVLESLENNQRRWMKESQTSVANFGAELSS